MSLSNSLPVGGTEERGVSSSSSSGTADNSPDQQPGPDAGAALSPERLTLTIAEAATALGIGRTFAYELARQGQIPTIRLGRRLLVPRRALQQLIDGEQETD